jgi:hypothetical protein
VEQACSPSRRSQCAPPERCHLAGQGVRSWTSKSLLSSRHPRDGVVERSGGGNIRSERDGAAKQICWADLDAQLA